MSRKSIQKNALSNSVPSFKETNYDIHELIYFKCPGKLFIQRTLKPNEEFNKEYMKKLINKKRTIQSQERMIYLTENGLRIKAYKKPTNSYKRLYLSYEQIEIIYISEGIKNILVLGIISKNQQIRAYECTKIKDDDDFKTLCRLLVQACENSERKLIELNPIGTLSMSSLYDNKRFSHGSLGSIVWTQSGEIDNELQSQLENRLYQNELIENENDVRKMVSQYSQNDSVTSIISSILKNEKGSNENMNSKIESSDTEGSDPVKHYNGINGDFNYITYEDDYDDDDNNNDNINNDNRYASAIYKADAYVEPILTPIFHADDESAKLYYRTGYEGDSYEENYEVTDLYPPSKWPAGVTFICPDSKSGATIAHLGPVYLYSERFVDVDNDCIENQTSA
ncbi:hypothetical protein MS3_00004299 [Schistosoma haematobium]|uniref:Trematode PH-like domain-containing protein n=1 Tax=Schistosoma haematobium TaxID=6185 RepID=A0A922LS75_SCHHA|nr:hypothetical protein MS3_00004299 [Schistosoma haematobium]KAH9592336.1 hypothetical protein MS3_00004299 [Schistosoma haematobium]